MTAGELMEALQKVAPQTEILIEPERHGEVLDLRAIETLDLPAETGEPERVLILKGFQSE